MAIKIRRLLILIILISICWGCNKAVIEGEKSQPKKPARLDHSLISISNLRFKIIENNHSGRIHVVFGSIQNNYSDTRKDIRVRCRLFNEDKILIRQDSVVAGIIASEDELRTTLVEDIKKQLKTPPSSLGSITAALPGQKLLFMFVFTDLSKNPYGYKIDAISSVKTNTGGIEFLPNPSSQNKMASPSNTELQNKINELVQRTNLMPDDLIAWAQLGNMYFDTGQIPKAIQAYEKSLALGPDQENVWTDLGVMYRRNRQPKKAIQCFDMALSIRSDHQIALYNKAIVLIKDLNNNMAAVEALQKLVQLDPNVKTPKGILVKDMLDELQRTN